MTKKKKWQDESLLYGPRLRWQIRLNRILNTNMVLPSSDEIFPFWLLKSIHKIKKYFALKKYIFKHGTYKDFCYYDVRYDPKEMCRSSYYNELFNSKNNQLIEAN